MKEGEGQGEGGAANALAAKTRILPCAPTGLPLARSRPRSRSGLTLATLSATRYFCPSFSSSAMTQSVTIGVHSA